MEKEEKNARAKEREQERKQKRTLGDLVIHNITKRNGLPAVRANLKQAVQAPTSLLYTSDKRVCGSAKDGTGTTECINRTSAR